MNNDPTDLQALVPLISQRAAAVEQAVADVDDAELWQRPAPGANPMGNIVLHLAGNLMNYIVRGVGGVAYERDRPFEFEAEGVSRDEVLSRFRHAVGASTKVLEAVDEESLDRVYGGPEYQGVSNRTVLLRSLEHLGYHTGQLVLLAATARR